MTLDKVDKVPSVFYALDTSADKPGYWVHRVIIDEHGYWTKDVAWFERDEKETALAFIRAWNHDDKPDDNLQ